MCMNGVSNFVSTQLRESNLAWEIMSKEYIYIYECYEIIKRNGNKNVVQCGIMLIIFPFG